MPNRTQRLTSLLMTVILVGLNLVALNVLIGGWSTARLDLTSERLYSITPATERILTSLDEDLTIHGYFSRRTHPKLAPLVPEIADLLEEFRAVSGGRVRLEIVDPGDDEEAEELAASRFGVRSNPFRLATKYESAIVNAYFSVVVQYADQYVRYGFDDLIAIESTPDGDIDVHLRNLEYDLTRAIKKVVFGFRSNHELFERVDGPVRLTGIWTVDTLPEMFAGVPSAVRQAADELAETGGERFEFDEIDPTGNEALQRELYESYGVQPLTLGFFGDEEFFLYALIQVGDRLEQVPLTGESLTAATVREAVESALRRQTPGFLKTVGVVTPDPPEIPAQLRMQMGMPPSPPPEFDEVQRFLQQDYNVEQVDLAAAGGVPHDVDLLLVLKPRDIGGRELFHLDQYLMRGGRLILCAGQYDVDFGPTGLNVTPLETGLDEWLAHHGVTISRTLVLDDRNQALPIPEVRNTSFGAIRTWALEPYPYLVQVRDDGFRNAEVSAALDAVGIYWGSPISIDEKAAANLDVIPLLRSSDRSWTDEDERNAGYVGYEVPRDGTGSELLAVALGGRFDSYFTEGRTPDRTGDAVGDEDGDDAGTDRTTVAYERSPETRLVVVANSEFLSDFVARALASVDGGFFTENLRFAENLIDWTGMDNDMLGIRARGMVSRRLDRLDHGREIAIEAVNHVAPAIVLFAVGAYLVWKRRQTAPLTAPGREDRR